MNQRAAPNLESCILIVRGQRVMLDVDLAKLFGVTAAQIAERVKRNRSRFPKDFMFQLSMAERNELVGVCRRLRRLKFSSALPLAFTEPGVLMLSGVLESPDARAASIEAIRGFIRVRKVIASDRDLARKLDAVERSYDAQFKEVFDAIRQLMEPPPGPRRPIGFGYPR